MRLIGLLGLALVVASCTQDQHDQLISQDHLFRNPTTGDIVKCSGGWRYGVIGMSEQQGQGSCDDRMWGQGFERLPPGTTPEAAAAMKK
jgi:hypothetical protein